MFIFFERYRIRNFFLLVDVSYCDSIYTLENDIPENILIDDMSKLEEDIRQRRLNEGEIILIYKNIIYLINVYS